LNSGQGGKRFAPTILRDKGQRMTNEEFQIACQALNDCRSVIAAGKTQRWDVVKWSVAVNLGLTTAFITLRPAVLIVVLMAAVCVLGWWLAVHYNRRVTGARDGAKHVVRWLEGNGVSYKAITGTDVESVYSDGEGYDKTELIIFPIIVGLSIVPVLLWWGCTALKP
jgi:hypothetical protein